MQRLALVEHKELTCRKCGATFVFDVEERRGNPRRGRGPEPTRCPACLEEEAEETDQPVCGACGEAIDVRGAEPSYCQRCYQEAALEAEAMLRQQANQTEALAAERDALAARVEELTRLLQSRECQIKKLSSRVESLERDWRNVTTENQELRHTLQNTELRLANADLEKRLVVSQYQDAGLQEVQVAVDALRRELRCKEQKLLERLAALEKPLMEQRSRGLRPSILSWLRPRRWTGKASSS